MKKEIRQEMILRRKNFLPSLIVISILFTVLIGIVYFTDPANQIFIFLFFLCLFLFLFFLLSLILANTRRGFISSVCITIFIIFRFFGVGNAINAILIVSLGIIAEIYARTTKGNKKHILPNS